MPAIKIPLLLAAIILTLLSNKAVSSVDATLEYAALQNYTVTSGERTVTRGCAGLMCTLSKLGTRWSFLNRYEGYKNRTWESPPLQINECSDSFLSNPKDNITSLRMINCRSDQDDRYYILRDNTIVSLRTPNGKDNTNIKITVYATKEKSDESLLKTELNQIILDLPITEETPSKTQRKITITQIPPLQIGEFEQLHKYAKKTWRNVLQRRHPPQETAQKIIDNMDPMLFRLDWRKLPNSELEPLNDIGFWLQQTQRCNDAVDAVAILQDVVRRAPQRLSARLNLAEAQARTLEDECKINYFSPSTTKVAMQENLRIYCENYGSKRIPNKISARIRKLLDVDALNAETCRSHQPIFQAIQSQNLELLSFVLSQHPEDIEQPSPSKGGNTPLFISISENWLAGAEMLLQAGADPNRSRPNEMAVEYETSPLHKAISNKSLDAVRLLLKYHASPDQTYHQSKPLAIAAAMRSNDATEAKNLLAILQELLDAGAKIDQKDPYGKTALMSAVQSGNLASVDMLLKRGAEINTLDNSGRNVLLQERALGSGHDLIWSLLLEHGGNVNQQDRTGRSPLFHLISWDRGNPETINSMVSEALKHHAFPNLKNLNSGQVALHIAAENGNLSVVNALLRAGANRCPLDLSGRSPGDLAAKRLVDLVNKPGCEEISSCSDIANFQEIIRILDCAPRKLTR